MTVRSARRLTLAAVGLAAAATLGACSRSEKAPPEAEAPVATGPAPATPVAVAPAAAVKPPGAEVIDATLASVQAWNAKASEELAAIAREEQRIRQAGAAAQTAARSGEGAQVRIAGARRSAEAAHAALTTARSALAGAAAAQTAGLQTALTQCAAPEVATYEGCVALTAEQALLSQTIATLEARYAAADAVWSQERPRLEEAAAAIALSGLR